MPKFDMKKDKMVCCSLHFISFQLDRTALHWAAANGNIDVIEKLIEDGADLESKDKVNIKRIVFISPFQIVLVLFHLLFMIKVLMNRCLKNRNKMIFFMLVAIHLNYSLIITYVFCFIIT